MTLWLLTVPYTGHLREGVPPKRAIGWKDAVSVVREVWHNRPIITMVILGGSASLFVGNAFQAKEALAAGIRFVTAHHGSLARELRLAAGLTGRGFAAAAGCQASKVSQIEKGVRPASVGFPVKSTCRSPSH